jgi:antibiotic biosynthesis monooxygenase (ABM) superfamily enzyme
MNKQQLGRDGIIMVRYKIISHSIDDFTVWKFGIDEHALNFKGYISTTVLYPAKNSDYHYVILRFDSKKNAKAWMYSDARTQMMKDSHATWMSDRQEVIHDWDIFWYRTFEGTKKWKQWAVTFMAVYPLTILVPMLVNEIVAVVTLSFFESVLRALLISGFMIFFIMPFMAKLFNKWLHR